MDLIINVTITETERRMLAQNSLERVLNTARSIHEDLDAFNKHEDGSMNIEDLDELSPLASRIWYAASSAAMFAKENDDST